MNEKSKKRRCSGNRSKVTVDGNVVQYMIKIAWRNAKKFVKKHQKDVMNGWELDSHGENISLIQQILLLYKSYSLLLCSRNLMKASLQMWEWHLFFRKNNKFLAKKCHFFARQIKNFDSLCMTFLSYHTNILFSCIPQRQNATIHEETSQLQLLKHQTLVIKTLNYSSSRLWRQLTHHAETFCCSIRTVHKDQLLAHDSTSITNTFKPSCLFL